MSLFAREYPARWCCSPLASVTGRSATADWCRVRWSGRLRLSGGRVGPKYFAGAAAAGSTAGRTNQTLLTLLPSDTICPCAFNCFLTTYMSPVQSSCVRRLFIQLPARRHLTLLKTPAYERKCVVCVVYCYCRQLSPFIPSPTLPHSRKTVHTGDMSSDMSVLRQKMKTLELVLCNFPSWPL